MYFLETVIFLDNVTLTVSHFSFPRLSLIITHCQRSLEEKTDKICILDRFSPWVVRDEVGRAYHFANHALLMIGCRFRTNRQQLKSAKDAG